MVREGDLCGDIFLRVGQLDSGLRHILSGDRSFTEHSEKVDSNETNSIEGIDMGKQVSFLTPLIHFACGNGHVEALQLLIQVGVSLVEY